MNSDELDPEELLAGLKFADRYGLTPKEVEVVIPFLDGPQSTLQISNKIEIRKVTVHGIIQRLKFKNLLSLEEVGTKGTFTYKLNLSKS